mgnify:CR=1 FL=1
MIFTWFSFLYMFACLNNSNVMIIGCQCILLVISPLSVCYVFLSSGISSRWFWHKFTMVIRCWKAALVTSVVRKGTHYKNTMSLNTGHACVCLLLFLSTNSYIYSSYSGTMETQTPAYPTPGKSEYTSGHKFDPKNPTEIWNSHNYVYQIKYNVSPLCRIGLSCRAV